MLIIIGRFVGVSVDYDGGSYKTHKVDSGLRPTWVQLRLARSAQPPGAVLVMLQMVKLTRLVLIVNEDLDSKYL